MTTLRAISYGGGVQSTALIVLAAQGVIDYPLALYSNVGDDSEHPATNAYVRDIMIPWAADRGVTVLERHRRTRDGEIETLWGRLMKEDSRSLPIPVRMANGAPGNRSCTADFKIRVVGKYLKEHGATAATPATVAVGISTDEVHRCHNRQPSDYEIVDYPLITLGLDRSACMRIIADAGLPVPIKSACFFCPFHNAATWAEQRRDEPELFWKSVELERTLNRRRDEISCATAGVLAVAGHDGPAAEGDDELAGMTTAGVRWGSCPDCDHRPMVLLAGDRVPPHAKDHVWLTRYNRPLDEAITEAQPALFGADGPESCDDGYCWT